MKLPRYAKAAWPEGLVPADEPSWLFYEIDENADAVIRDAHVYVDGRVTRNSIEIEERSGNACSSLIDCSLAEGFGSADLEEITAEAFEAVWDSGVDTPFWYAS